MATTTTTETVPETRTTFTASSPDVVYGKLRYIPRGNVPEPSPHNFHLPAMKEFGDVRSLPLTDMRPVPTVAELPTAKEGAAQLPTHGFTAVDHPTTLNKAPFTVDDWKNPEKLMKYYAPDTEEMVKAITGAKTVITESYILRSATWTEQDALSLHFGHGESTKTEEQREAERKEQMGFPQFVGFNADGGASPAPKVHLDYAPNGARLHLRKYHPTLTDFAADIIAAEDKLLAEGKNLREDYAGTEGAPRWALFSIWRPIKPVKRDPLALGDARSFAEEDYLPVDVKSPCLGVEGEEFHNVESYLAHGDDKHEWYYISNHKPDEVLVIGLFDSDRDKYTVAAGGTLHSSVDLPGTENEETRESVELRCLAIW